MDIAFHFRGQGLVDQPLPLDPSKTTELIGDNRHAKVAFAFRAGTGMAGMKMGFINNIKMLRRQRRFQFLFDGLRDAHGNLRAHSGPCALSGLTRVTILRP